VYLRALRGKKVYNIKMSDMVLLDMGMKILTQYLGLVEAVLRAIPGCTQKEVSCTVSRNRIESVHRLSSNNLRSNK
jgi:hypothetical protein